MGTDEFIVLDNNAERKIEAGNIPLSAFSNDANFTSNIGDITGVTAGTFLSGGGFGGGVTLDFDPAGTINGVITSNGSGNGATVETNLIFNGTDLRVVGGDVVAFYSSDKRLKDNITPISNPIKKILQIGGYTFNWNEKQDTYEGQDVGVIAQEVEKVLPEVVENRENGYKAVKYEKMVPLLIEAIKDQQKQIDELKELVNKLTK